MIEEEANAIIIRRWIDVKITKESRISLAKRSYSEIKTWNWCRFDGGDQEDEQEEMKIWFWERRGGGNYYFSTMIIIHTLFSLLCFYYSFIGFLSPHSLALSPGLSVSLSGLSVFLSLHGLYINLHCRGVSWSLSGCCFSWIKCPLMSPLCYEPSGFNVIYLYQSLYRHLARF